MRQFLLPLLLCTVAALVPVAPVQADVTLPAIFRDGMVLQRNSEIPVWGTAAAGEEVTVQLDGKSATATAGKEGNWMVRLPAMKAGGPHTLEISGSSQLKVDDVLVGEVWICSGQSNMEWPMTRTMNAKEEIAAASDDQLRLFHVKRTRAAQPATAIPVQGGYWNATTPETVKSFSAVGYFFGKHLREQLKVPVGLIESAWGGTPAEHWTPGFAFESHPELLVTSDHPHAVNVMKGRSSLYNGMIAPLVPYAVGGVIWYQGESNVPMGAHYGKLFQGMINGWRTAWKNEELPFLFVQIAPWKYDKIKGWPITGAPLVREGQLQTTRALPKTGIVVTTDIGNVDDIHPRNKQEVGRRLGLAARSIVFGEDVESSGPLYREMKQDGSSIVLMFDHADGLTSKDGPLHSFLIAGEDGKFVEATARIKGSTVVVHSDSVEKPVAVRFGFTDEAEPNLFNGAGLPASPFRTDDLPVGEE